VVRPHFAQQEIFEIEMEPEIVTWLDKLTFTRYQRVMRNVDDYLVDRGDMLDWKLHRERRLREGALDHPEYEQAGLDLRLGDMVRERRKELGLTQGEVAEQAGIAQPALSRIEGGGGVPTLAMLDRIAKAMHTTFTITVGDRAAV
jgi:DNA-binding XRE family transcriptional regulator